MNNITENIDRQSFQSPKTYFDLIHKVGSNGKYQSIFFWIFFFNCFITGILLMSTSFFFLSPNINCAQLNFEDITCQEFVCALPQNKRQKYLEIEINSLAVQFGPFECEKKNIINLLRMTLYVGAIFGYVIIPLVTDNYGRKTSMIGLWAVTLFGIFVLSLSFNLQMASLGLFLAGFGCESGVRTMMTIFGEIVDDRDRQKNSIGFSISFGFGQIFIGLFFYMIKDWRYFTIICCLIPGVIQLILLLFYLEETPKFLLKKDKHLAVQDLNRIAVINGLQKDTITLSDVEHVMNENVVQEQIRTPLALFKFQSQRLNCILMCLIFFSLAILYYGPMIIISKLKMNIYFSQLVLGSSEILAYFVCYLFIDKLPRKLSGYRFLGLTSIFFFALVFFSPPKDCNNCLSGIIQLMLVFSARFFLCFYMAVFFLYITEIFPLPLRATGFGVISLWGAVASTCSQFILTTLADKKHNPMVLFTILSVTTCMYLYPLPETLGRRLQEHIPQQKAGRKTLSKNQSEKISLP